MTAKRIDDAKMMNDYYMGPACLYIIILLFTYIFTHTPTFTINSIRVVYLCLPFGIIQFTRHTPHNCAIFKYIILPYDG